MRAITGDRWTTITQLAHPTTGPLLDIGCRDRQLAAHVPDYTGMDLQPPADIVASADEHWPFDDGTYATVVMADVLEHLEHPHHAMNEAARVATGAIVVLLPNLYTLAARGRYLTGRTMDKYDFGPDASQDRHRWLMSFSQARAFTHGRARANGWHVTREAGYVFPFRRRAARAAYRAARVLGPDVWAWEYAARLEPS